MKMVIDQVEITYHFISDEVVFIDLFFVPTHLQGKGLGSSVLNKFIKRPFTSSKKRNEYKIYFTLNICIKS